MNTHHVKKVKIDHNHHHNNHHHNNNPQKAIIKINDDNLVTTSTTSSILGNVYKKSATTRIDNAIPFDCSEEEAGAEIDLDEFEICQYGLFPLPYLSGSGGGGSHGSSTIGEESYISLDRFDSTKKTLVVGVIKKPDHPLYQETVKFFIKDYSLMFETSTSWSLWVRESQSMESELWFKLQNPHERYKHIHSIFEYKYLLSMHITSFIEFKTEKTLANMEWHLKNKLPAYIEGDLDKASEFITHHVPKLVKSFGQKTKKMVEDQKARLKFIEEYQSSLLAPLVSSKPPADWYTTKKSPLKSVVQPDDRIKKVITQQRQQLKQLISQAQKQPSLSIRNMPDNMMGYHTYSTVKGKSPDEHFEYNSVDEKEFTKDLLPFLQCMVCKQGKHICTAHALDTAVPTSKETIEVFEEYLLHLEDHKSYLERSLSYNEKLELQTRAMVNQFRIRTVVEGMQELAEMENNREKKHPPIHWPSTTKRKHIG